MIDFMGFQIRLRDRLSRWVILFLCLMPVGGAFLYNWGFQLTEGKCLFQRLFGFPSPSCGLTRSFMAIARNDWATALSFHAFGPFIFGAFVLTAAHMGVELMTGRSFTPWYRRIITVPIVPVSLGILFFAYYGVRLYVRYHVGDVTASGIAGGMAELAIWQGFVTGAKAL